MFSFPIIKSFPFFSLILVSGIKFLFPGWSLLLLTEVHLPESNTEGYSDSILLPAMIPGHPFTFQKLFMKLKIFFARQLVSAGFGFIPFLPRF